MFFLQPWFFGAQSSSGWVKIAAPRRNWIMEAKLLYYLWLLGTASHPASSKTNRARIIQLNRFPFDSASSPIQYFCFYPSPPQSRLSSNSIQTGRIFLVLSMTDLFLILVHFSTRSHSSTGFNLIAEIGRRRRKLFSFFHCVWFLFENSIVEKLWSSTHSPCSNILSSISFLNLIYFESRLCKHHWRPRAIDVGRLGVCCNINFRDNWAVTLYGVHQSCFDQFPLIWTLCKVGITVSGIFEVIYVF